MAYYDQINILKNALNGYSAEEEKINALYKTAKENAQKETQEAKKQLDRQYYRDRNEVYADNARDERNFNNALAERGLGFSGEAAQAKLNSNIILNNRLGQLIREKNEASNQYDIELGKTISSLSMEEAAKLNEMLQSKNNLNAQIAEMELKKETDDADRQAEKDMQADKLAAEKALQDAALKAEKENTAAKLQADKENNQAKIQAEFDLQNAKLQAEKDMLEAELAAKYCNAVSGGTGNSGGSSGKGDTTQTQDEAIEGGYIPDISAKELAGKLVSATGHKNIYSDWDEYTINKYLLELMNNYNMDSDYYKELLFVLKAYGYEESTEPEMRVQVISYEMSAYDKNNYEKLYDRYVVLGESENSASKKAREDILNYQLDYMYRHSRNLTEFRMCCKKLGIGSTKTQEYINRKISLANKANGSTGSIPGFPNRVAK